MVCTGGSQFWIFHVPVCANCRSAFLRRLLELVVLEELRNAWGLDFRNIERGLMIKGKFTLCDDYLVISVRGVQGGCLKIRFSELVVYEKITWASPQLDWEINLPNLTTVVRNAIGVPLMSLPCGMLFKRSAAVHGIFAIVAQSASRLGWIHGRKVQGNVSVWDSYSSVSSWRNVFVMKERASSHSINRSHTWHCYVVE